MNTPIHPTNTPTESRRRMTVKFPGEVVTVNDDGRSVVITVPISPVQVLTDDYYELLIKSFGPQKAEEIRQDIEYQAENITFLKSLVIS